jgi:hypothetical protein
MMWETSVRRQGAANGKRWSATLVAAVQQGNPVQFCENLSVPIDFQMLRKNLTPHGAGYIFPLINSR